MSRERLQETAQLSAVADAKRDKWWNRGPIVVWIITALCAGAGDAAILHYRVSQIEKLSAIYEKENFPEQIRSNKAYIDVLKSDRQVGVLEQLHTQRRRISALEGHPESE